jgi:hypothetical protein
VGWSNRNAMKSIMLELLTVVLKVQRILSDYLVPFDVIYLRIKQDVEYVWRKYYKVREESVISMTGKNHDKQR